MNPSACSPIDCDIECDVTVIVPTYNRAHYLRECLDSLLSQTKAALEIIVVDDGSEDDTATIVQSYADRVLYLYKENSGKPASVNLALSRAKGDLIWIFDDDDVAVADAIETRVAVLKKNPSAGFVYSPHYLGSDGNDGKIQRDRLYQPPIYDHAQFFFELMKGCFFHLASALVRLRVYQEVGQFDGQLLSSEDYDMQIRLSRVSHAVYCESPSFIFRQHAGVRGARSIRYTSNKRPNVFRKYDRQVGLKLRAQFSLQEFAQNRIIPADSPKQLRLALLRRMLVMASKGCITEMFDDLNRAVDIAESTSRFSDEELQLISQTMFTGYSYDAIQSDPASFFSLVDTIPASAAGKQARLSMAKGAVILARSYPRRIADRARKLRLSIFIFFNWLKK